MTYPVFSCTVAAIRPSIDVFLVRTPVVGGGPLDYTEFEMFDQGPLIGIQRAWSLRSIRAYVDGVIHRLMDQSAFGPGKVGTVEFAMNVGLQNQPLASHSMYGFGHGQMTYIGAGVFLDGAPANYRDALPAGAVIRGNSLLFDANYRGNTHDGLPVTSISLAHIFDADGLRVSQTHDVLAGGCSMQNSYSAMLPATNCDRVSAGNGPALTIGLGNGAQVGNWGEKSSFQLWNTARPNVRLEMRLPYGAPSDSPTSWADCTTSKTFLLDNPANQKLYVNCRSGASPSAFTGRHNYLTAYSVRKI